MTDFCTFFPEGNWAHCCKAHDMAYSLTRREADLALASCVAGETWDVIAITMFVGVSLFGRLFYKRKSK